MPKPDKNSAEAAVEVPATVSPAKLRLKWRETWPGEGYNDFSAFDRRMKGEVVARIYEL
ncbi:hypothetical protein [Mesorhizobium sp. CN2-181]|uniref:hypothetical protein n=1 Tax=Mesorhizobium TaxID=68287 RepID=UPI0032B7948D